MPAFTLKCRLGVWGVLILAAQRHDKYVDGHLALTAAHVLGVGGSPLYSPLFRAAQADIHPPEYYSPESSGNA
ncbi:hypothetical protein N7453_010997 [Penicillium expansum]|nr:hypothetical protein N7453_010997 [Penicillium expansum]